MIAVMIMMHKNPHQVLRLVKWYASSETVCFIHVDSKLQIDMAEYEKELKAVKPETILMEERLSGVLATWRLVEITMKLMERALCYEEEHRIHFSYYQLLSGQDYPIGKYAEWVELLETSYPTVYLNLCSKPGDVLRSMQRVRYTKPRSYMADHVPVGWQKPLTGVIHLYEMLVTFICGTPQEKLQKRGMQVAWGAAWWIIPDELARETMAVYRGEGSKKRRILRDTIKNISTPEESFFQSVFANSKFKDDKPGGNLTYCNFATRGRVNTGHPYILEMADLASLKYWADRDHFFARKFDETVDHEIMDAVDQWH